MFSEHQLKLYAEQEKAREEKRQQWGISPAKMARPANVRIKQDRFGAVSSGLFVSEKAPGARKLLPGEVVTVDLDWPVVQRFLGKGQMEVVTEQATRPLIYESGEDALATDPKSRGISQSDREAARQRIQKQLQAWRDELNKKGGPRQGVVSAMDEDLRDAVAAAEKDVAKLKARDKGPARPKEHPKDTLAAPRHTEA